MRATSAMLGLAAATAFSSAAVASPCTQTALTKYTAAGFSCTVGKDTFSDFAYVSDKTIAAADVTVIPRDHPTDPGLSFFGSWHLNGASATASFDLDFKVTAAPSNISGASLVLTGHASGPGHIIDTETLSGPVSAQLTAIETAASSISGFVTFPPVRTQITVSDEVDLKGLETLSVITKRFPDSPEVPEPASLAVVGIGLAAMGLVRRRRR